MKGTKKEGNYLKLLRALNLFDHTLEKLFFNFNNDRYLNFNKKFSKTKILLVENSLDI
jgi:heme oxygenase